MRNVVSSAVFALFALPTVGQAQASGSELAMVTASEARPPAALGAGVGSDTSRRGTTVSTVKPPPPLPARGQSATAPALPSHGQPMLVTTPATGTPDDDRGIATGHGYDLEQDDSVDCALGDLCLGPVLNLGVINPVGFGLHARVGDYFGFGFDYQFLPEVSIASATTSASLVTVDARAYPFAGAFFLSGGFAYQVLSASASADMSDPFGNDYAVEVEGSVGIPMLKLGLGFFGREGLVMGIDVAVEVPLADTVVEFSASDSGVSEIDPDAMANLESDVEKAAESILDVMPVLVQVNLLRLGYVF